MWPFQPLRVTWHCSEGEENSESSQQEETHPAWGAVKALMRQNANEDSDFSVDVKLLCVQEFPFLPPLHTQEAEDKSQKHENIITVL